ncbi:hypothetical protein LCGC14_2828070, partial [marine sediment metagenome]
AAAEGIVVCDNGTDGTLFLSNQVEQLDVDEKGIREFSRAYKKEKVVAWLQVFQELRVEPFPGLTKEETLELLAATFYVSPWLNRWKGTQVPLEIATAEAGSGKAQDMNAKILTTQGWIKMGDISVGDQIITPEGTPSEVVSVFPQGLKKLYRVTFHDGSSTKCCEEHLWHVQTPDQRWAERPGVVKPLHEILKKDLRYVNKNRFRNYIPMVASTINLTVDGSALKLLDPYLLGALLGDGGFRSGQPSFTSEDQFILDEVQRRLPDGDELVRSSRNAKRYDHRINGGKVKEAVKGLGLWGHKSVEKFVPKHYLWTTYENRLALLQGLMDTDGSAVTAGAAVFNSSSEQLTKDTQFLIQSLGGTASISLRTAPLKQGHNLAYNVHIRLPLGMCPFLLPRKADYF